MGQKTIVWYYVTWKIYVKEQVCIKVPIHTELQIYVGQIRGFADTKVSRGDDQMLKGNDV